jgi:hypothetical protein
MPNWKKVVVSGSSGQLLNITSSGQISASLGIHGVLQTPNSVDSAQYVDASIDNAHLANNAVNTDEIANDAVTYAKMQNLGTANRVLGSTSTGNIGEVQITVDMMAANSVDSDQYVDDSIDTAHYAAGSVDATALASNAVTNAKMADNAVDTAEIAASAVETDKINNLAVTTAKIADDAVTGDKLSNSITIAADLTVVGSIIISTGKISYGTNTDVDEGTENVATATGAEAAFFDYVVKNSTNVRAGTITAATDATNVEYNEISTVDLGDTSDIKLKVVLSSGDLILQATAASDNWSVSSFIRYMAL